MHLHCEYNLRQNGILLEALTWTFVNHSSSVIIYEYIYNSVNDTGTQGSYTDRIIDFEEINAEEHSMILIKPTCHDIGKYICSIVSLQTPPIVEHGRAKFEGNCKG